MKSELKLKPIPSNTVVHTPTEAEAKELLAILHANGYKWCHGKDLSDISIMAGKEAVGINFDNTRKNTIINFRHIETARRERFTILTLAEFKKMFVLNEDNFAKSDEEKPQPKFKVGDKVRIIQDDSVNPDYVGIVDEIASIGYRIKLKNTDSNWTENALEPYPEPEIKPTEDMETKDEAKEAKGGTKELNLCELLREHEGEVFYSLIAGKCMLKEIIKDAGYPICIILNACAIREHLTKDGKRFNVSDAGCMLYPSRELWQQYPLDPLKAWQKWREEQTIFHIRIEFQPYEERGEMKCGNMGTLHFDDLKLHTPTDRDKCISEIKAIIEKYAR